jgi:hypothetical protein
MNEIAIIHKLTIFDKRRVRFMNELITIRFRAMKISSTTKKKNKRSSCRSLKAKMKNLLRHRVHVDFDSNKEHRQKTFATARSIKKNRKLIIDSDSNRENRLHRFFVQTKDSRNNIDFVSMRLK